MNLNALQKVFEHAQFVDQWCAENGGIRVMTALFGSQNYNLDSENSDVDTKSIIIPELDDWSWGDVNKYNTTLELPDGSHAETKHLAEMLRQYMKCNINFLETLYTEYVDIAPGWEWLYDELICVRQQITTHNMYKMGRTWVGYLVQALQRAFTSTSVSLGYNEEVDYNPKSLMNAMRIKESFIKFFEFHRSFDEAIDMSGWRSMLLAVKNHPMPRDVAIIFGRDIEKWIDDHAIPYLQEHYEDKEDFNIDWYMRQLCVSVQTSLYLDN